MRLSLATLALLGTAGSLAAGALHAQTTAPRIALQPVAGSTLAIEGSTTVGASWRCAATDLVASADLTDDAQSADLDAVRLVTVQVPVEALRCGNARMERAMRVALKAENDPTSAIVGRFSDRTAEHADRPAPAGTAVLGGTLSVARVEREVTLQATVETQPDGTLRVRSTVPLTLTQFGITPPRVLFGMVQARDSVNVQVDLVFRRVPVVADGNGRK